MTLYVVATIPRRLAGHVTHGDKLTGWHPSSTTRHTRTSKFTLELKTVNHRTEQILSFFSRRSRTPYSKNFITSAARQTSSKSVHTELYFYFCISLCRPTRGNNELNLYKNVLISSMHGQQLTVLHEPFSKTFSFGTKVVDI